MPDRAYDWLKQAERDLNYARESLRLGYFEWVCGDSSTCRFTYLYTERMGGFGKTG